MGRKKVSLFFHGKKKASLNLKPAFSPSFLFLFSIHFEKGGCDIMRKRKKGGSVGRKRMEREKKGKLSQRQSPPNTHPRKKGKKRIVLPREFSVHIRALKASSYPPSLACFLHQSSLLPSSLIPSRLLRLSASDFSGAPNAAQRGSEGGVFSLLARDRFVTHSILNLAPQKTKDEEGEKEVSPLNLSQGGLSVPHAAIR